MPDDRMIEEQFPDDLAGDCSIDCLERCAYPGMFSECSIGADDDG